MRYVVGLASVLVALMGLPQNAAAQTGQQATAKAALPIHASHRLAPQLRLRASYYLYLDADPLSGTTLSGPASQPTLKLEGDSAGVEVKPLEELERQQQANQRRRAIGIGVGVALGVGLAIGVGVGVWAAHSIEVF